ncbi:MAG: nucleotidyltransferase family protein [Hyphomicrobiales bacterium]
MRIGDPERWLIDILRGDTLAVDCLNAVRDMDLPDGWIGAGFVRNKAWDVLHGRERFTPLNDVDVVYFDRSVTERRHETALEQRLAGVMPGVPWSVRNQARMHIRNGDPPYADTADALAHWVETATAVAARSDNGGAIHILAPFGLDDLVNLILRPTPAFTGKRDAFDRRLAAKGWCGIWPKLAVA